MTQLTHNFDGSKCTDTIMDKYAKRFSRPNKKFLGDNVFRLFRLSCLSEYLGVSVEDLLAQIEEFKAQGSKLFS